MCRPNSSQLKEHSKKWCFLREHSISDTEHFPSCWKKCQHHKDCEVDTGKDPVVPQMPYLVGGKSWSGIYYSELLEKGYYSLLDFLK